MRDRFDMITSQGGLKRGASRVYQFFETGNLALRFLITFIFVVCIMAVYHIQCAQPSPLPITDEVLYPIVVNNRWGYINDKGDVVVAPVFAFANHFEDGVATVELFAPWYCLWPPFDFDNYISKILNQEGSFSKSSFRRLSSFSDGLHPAQETKDFGVVRLHSKRSGYINTNGDWVVLPAFSAAEPFSGGVAAVQLDSKRWGFIDKDGNLIIDCMYKEVNGFSDGLAWVLPDNDDRWGAIDLNGTMRIEPTYASSPTPVVDGVTGIPLNTGSWALLRLDDETIIADNLEFIFPFREGLAIARQNGMYGFMDTSGTWVAKPQYRDAHGFSEGMAAVFDGNRWGFVDKCGNLVIPCHFTGARNMRFVNGLANVNEEYELKTVGPFDYIDKTGSYVWQK